MQFPTLKRAGGMEAPFLPLPMGCHSLDPGQEPSHIRGSVVRLLKYLAFIN